MLTVEVPVKRGRQGDGVQELTFRALIFEGKREPSLVGKGWDTSGFSGK